MTGKKSVTDGTHHPGPDPVTEGIEIQSVD